MCCQAAGGEAAWADELTLAWLLAYAAADLMDSVQDQDDPDAWWRELGAGAALATASGLYFSASLALENLHQRQETSQAAAEIIHDFYSAFMVMTSGQLTDLTAPQRDLETYWQLASAKSGAFFRLACRAGARLATSDLHTLDAYATYGAQLGELIQIRDDLEDIRLLRSVLKPEYKKKISSSLPVVYALSVSPPELQRKLTACLEAADTSQQAVDDLVALLDQLGAALYVQIEIDKRRSLALQALEQAMAHPPYANTLMRFIQEPQQRDATTPIE